MDRAELAFFPAPGVGHLAPMVELAKVLTTRDDRLSVTVFIMNHSKINTYTQALLSNQPPPRMQFVHLSLDESTSEHLRSLPRGQWMPELVRIHKSRVNEFLSSASTHRLAAFVVDIFCTAFIDVATAEFGVPSYVFFTSSLDCLSLLFHLQSLHDDEKCDITEFKDSDAELRIPGFLTPVPANVWLYSVFDKDTSGAMTFVRIPRRLRKIKGILVNTFAELESHALGSLSDDFSIPPIYAVGPVLNLNPGTSNDGNNDQYKDIMMWLECQPQTSVVFLCFGSMGTFEAEQVVEIARALERSGHRFLWSLRRPPLEGNMGVPTEYENLNEVLPKGFLDRTQEIGKVIGWAPQVAVLSHPAIGGFVSHCGWNSILESLWCGVPMATWPLFAEQQLNAFELVKELGLAVEIKIEYRKDNPVLLTSEEIGKGIKQLMEGSVSAKIRNEVKAMRLKSRKAIIEDGSSYVAVGQFIDVVLSSSPQDITR